MYTEAQCILLGPFTRKAMMLWINSIHLLRRQFLASLTYLFAGSENPRRHNLLRRKCYAMAGNPCLRLEYGPQTGTGCVVITIQSVFLAQQS